MFSPFLSRFVRESSAFHCYAYRENKGDKRNTWVHRSCPQRSLVCEENRQINFGALWLHSGPLCVVSCFLTRASMGKSNYYDKMKWQDSIKGIITQKLHQIRNWEFHNMLNGMSTIEMIENLKLENLTENRVIRRTVGQNGSKVRQNSVWRVKIF